MAMAKKTLKLRTWTKDDVRMLKSLAREKTKTTVIARKLKRTVGATYQQAHKLGVSLGSRPRDAGIDAAEVSSLLSRYDEATSCSHRAEGAQRGLICDA